MEKKIEDYLHFYIGARHRYRFVDWSKDSWSVWMELTPKRLDYVLSDRSIDGIQIELRSVTDMTEDEKNSLIDFLGLQEFLTSSDIEQGFLDVMCDSEYRFSPDSYYKSVAWFTKNRFDVFELIKDGFAINATTLTKQSV